MSYHVKKFLLNFLKGERFSRLPVSLYFTPHPVPIQLPRSPIGRVLLLFKLNTTKVEMLYTMIDFQEDDHGIRRGECHDGHGV